MFVYCFFFFIRIISLFSICTFVVFLSGSSHCLFFFIRTMSFFSIYSVVFLFWSSHWFFFFYSEHLFDMKFNQLVYSEADDPIFTELYRKVDPHLKRCHQVLEFSKWPPLPWKPWTYVKIFDLTYIGNCQRDFHKTWHIY